MSTRRSLELLLALVLLAVGPVLQAAQPLKADPAAAESSRIARERAEVEARAKVAEAACRQEFAVSACLRQARAERRAGLRHLERQQALLDDAQRKQRAADRLDRIRERQEAAAREQARPKVEVRSRADRAPAPERSASDVAAVEAEQAQRAARAASAASAADVKAGQRADAATQRAQQAQAHREAVELRNQARAAKKAPSASLPVPGTPAVPASAPR